MELHHSSETEAPKKVTKLFLNMPLARCTRHCLMTLSGEVGRSFFMSASNTMAAPQSEWRLSLCNRLSTPDQESCNGRGPAPQCANRWRMLRGVSRTFTVRREPTGDPLSNLRGPMFHNIRLANCHWARMHLSP